MRDKKIQVHADIIVDKARARRQSGACQTRLRCYALKDSAAGDSGANFRVLLQKASTLSSRTIDSHQFWRNFSREGRLSLFSTSSYAASATFHCDDPRRRKVVAFVNERLTDAACRQFLQKLAGCRITRYHTDNWQS